MIGELIVIDGCEESFSVSSFFKVWGMGVIIQPVKRLRNLRKCFCDK